MLRLSPALRAAQGRTLDGVPATWHATLAEVPDGPAIVVANEFLDALPVRQMVRGTAGWHERHVGLGPDGALVFGVAAEPDPAIPPAGRPGDVLEVGRAAAAVADELARRLARFGGAALLVDYGHLRTAPGETLQAVRGHTFADPLARPGEQDLTAHVDFAALARTARSAGAAVHGPASQGAFLRALGIAERAERLKRGRAADAAAAIDAALHRLTAPGDGMGELFKAMAIADSALPALPGLAALAVPAARSLEPAC